MELFGMDCDNLKCTIEEWEILFRAMAAGPEEGKIILFEFYVPRCRAIIKSDELNDFELEKEYTLEEFSRFKQGSS
ncbi:MAG: hypothetical protein HQL14_07000 [Candidatus Omnitrophica bacterium]|nr:hypothetical protein [Candidatus Omnitrophota bacterium]